MKKNRFLLPTLLLLPMFILEAQNNGCDGTRYKNNVFAAFKKTTVVYAPTIGHLGNAMDLSMDVYEPQGDVATARPVVILAHGGSFISGARTDMDPWCQLLAKKGYVAATISYRLFPFLTLGFPDSTKIFDTAVKAVGDMRAAVRYFREDAATGNQFKVDGDHIFIGGFSAGAVTALHCSYLDNGDAIPAFLQTIMDNNGGLDGISGTASNKTYPSDSKAVVNMSGGIYSRLWINASDVPIVSIHGTADGVVPFVSGLAASIAFLEGSSLIHARAQEVGLWSFLEVVPGAGHTNLYTNSAFQTYVDTFWVKATTLLESLTCSSVGVLAPVLPEDGWSVSPNPNSVGRFTLQLPESLERADIKILNNTGAVVFERKGLEHNETVTMPGLPGGLYMVLLNDPRSPEKRFTAKKLVVD